MLALYGHPFSSYTWKALIPLYANATPFEFREVGPDHPDHAAFVAAEHPAGKFPILVDGETIVLEATAIIDYLAAYHPGDRTSVVQGKSGSVREDLGGRRIIKKKQK